MKGIINNNENRLTREKITNSFPNNTLNSRLINSKVVDYKDNMYLEDLGNGYVQISAIDKNKFIKN